MADVDGGGMASCQQPIFLPCNRSAEWQSCKMESTYEAEMWHQIPLCRKNCIHWYQCLLNIYGDQTAEMNTDGE